MKNLKFLLLTLLAFTLLSQPVFAQKEKGNDDPKKEKEGDKKDAEKKYPDIITADAITDQGLFTVHQVKDKYYFEVPLSLLGKEILVVSCISGHVKGLNFGGAGMRSRPQQVVRWQLQGKNVLLRSVSYNSVADENLPIYTSVKNNNFEPVVANFALACYNKDSTAIVFEPGSFFTTDVPMIGALSDNERKEFAIKGLEEKRSYIESIKSTKAINYPITKSRAPFPSV